MAPIVHGLEVEFHDRVEFVYLNIEDSATEEFKKQLGYRYQPHFFLINAEGEIIQQWLGPVSEEELRQSLEDVSG
jgi:thioredoxin-like negative regulator of GroEL